MIYVNIVFVCHTFWQIVASNQNELSQSFSQSEDGSAHEERRTNVPINLKKCAKTVRTKNEKQYIMVKVNGAANKPTPLQP
jgi:hypothetical protein